MAPTSRKRLSDEANLPRTPSKQQPAGVGINAYFESLCQKLDIDLPYNEVESPSKRRRTPGHECVRHIQLLFYQRRETLDHVVEQLLASTPQKRSQDARLTHVYRKLQVTADLVSNQLTPSRRKLTFLPIRPTPAADTEDGIVQPPSPTMAVKHKPNTTTGLTSANTSFTTLATSFTSNGAEASQDTAPTSVGSFQDGPASIGTQDSWPTSSLGLDDAQVDNLERRARCDPRSALHRVLSIPLHGFGAPILPAALSGLPFALRAEASRVAQCANKSLDELLTLWRYPRSWSNLHECLDQLNFSTSFQRGSPDAYDNSTLCGNMTFSDKGPVFEFRLQAPRKEALHSIQRKYGCGRVLHVTFPSLSKAPLQLRQHDISKAFKDMLAQPHALLGRTWHVLHLKVDTDESQVAFFAVDGVDLQKQKLSDVQDWFLQFGLNADQPSAKLASRMDLAMSRSTPTITFEPNQIHYNAPDTLSSDIVFDTTFDDSQLSERFRESRSHFNPDDRQVMSDGCAKISYAAMNVVRMKLKLSYVPAAVQGRIYGAKGVWYCSGDRDSDKIGSRSPTAKSK